MIIGILQVFGRTYIGLARRGRSSIGTLPTDRVMFIFSAKLVFSFTIFSKFLGHLYVLFTYYLLFITLLACCYRCMWVRVHSRRGVYWTQGCVIQVVRYQSICLRIKKLSPKLNNVDFHRASAARRRPRTSRTRTDNFNTYLLKKNININKTFGYNEPTSSQTSNG